MVLQHAIVLPVVMHTLPAAMERLDGAVNGAQAAREGAAWFLTSLLHTTKLQLPSRVHVPLVMAKVIVCTAAALLHPARAAGMALLAVVLLGCGFGLMLTCQSEIEERNLFVQMHQPGPSRVAKSGRRKKAE